MYIAVLIFCLLGVETLPQEDSSLGVVGGDPVDITEVPFMARYFGPYRKFRIQLSCGATIVAPTFVISSASCYMNFRSSQSHVAVGTDKTDKGEEVVYLVKEGYPHPKNEYMADYDIAVLKLRQPIKFNERVKAIPLAKKDFVVPEGAMFDTMGFGTTSTSGHGFKLPDQLHKVSLPHIPFEKCKQSYPDFTKRMICAGADGKRNGYFEEGGPLVYKDMLLGVIIKDIGCGKKDQPSRYAYIPALRDFIDVVIDATV